MEYFSDVWHFPCCLFCANNTKIEQFVYSVIFSFWTKTKRNTHTLVRCMWTLLHARNARAKWILMLSYATYMLRVYVPTVQCTSTVLRVLGIESRLDTMLSVAMMIFLFIGYLKREQRASVYMCGSERAPVVNGFWWRMLDDWKNYILAGSTFDNRIQQLCSHGILCVFGRIFLSVLLLLLLLLLRFVVQCENFSLICVFRFCCLNFIDVSSSFSISPSFVPFFRF